MTPEEEQSGDLRDVALADEIELVSDLVVAASSSPRHFTPDEVDELLGVPVDATDSATDSATDDPSADAGDAGAGAGSPEGSAGGASSVTGAPAAPSLADPAS